MLLYNQARVFKFILVIPKGKKKKIKEKSRRKEANVCVNQLRHLQMKCMVICRASPEVSLCCLARDPGVCTEQCWGGMGSKPRCRGSCAPAQSPPGAGTGFMGAQQLHMDMDAKKRGIFCSSGEREILQRVASGSLG